MYKCDWYIADYGAATAHLSTLEDLAYRRLLDAYYLDEKPIPKEKPNGLRRIRFDAQSDQYVRAFDQVLSEFFVLEHDGWHQKRADKELSRSLEIIEKRKKSGKLGGRPKGFSTENQMVSEKKPNALLSPSPSPSPSLLGEVSPNNPSVIFAKNGHFYFDQFWKRYPRKEGKKRALDVWKRKHLESEEKATPIVVDVVKRSRDHKSWQDGFIPHASTYLNGERWEDEITEEAK